MYDFLPNLNFLLYHILFSVFPHFSVMASIYADPAVTAASKAFRDMIKTVFGDTYNNIPESQEQDTFWEIGEICGNLINSPKFGPESAEFKAAEAKYMEISQHGQHSWKPAMQQLLSNVELWVRFSVLCFLPNLNFLCLYIKQSSILAHKSLAMANNGTTMKPKGDNLSNKAWFKQGGSPLTRPIGCSPTKIPPTVYGNGTPASTNPTAVTKAPSADRRRTGISQAVDMSSASAQSGGGDVQQVSSASAQSGGGAGK
jgi:hypothetical protein